MRALFLGLALLASSTVFAEDHGLTNVTGTQIELKAYDHAIAGSVKHFVIFGSVDEATFSSDLTMKKDGELIKTRFERGADGKIGGTIVSKNGLPQTRMVLKKFLGQEQSILFDLNGEDLVVKIDAEGFENNHFTNPTYTATYHGETVSFKMENGKACYGFSTHLSFLIFGAYFH